MNLPGVLTTFKEVAGLPVAKVLLDLTVYLEQPTVDEFDWLVELYISTCPADRLSRFKIAELVLWSDLRSPVMTESALEAEANRIVHPYFEATRRRIRAGRSFEAQYWDGFGLDRSDGTWAFNVRGLKLRTSGLHSFVRFLFPLQTDLAIPVRIADKIAQNVRFLSGHGGLVFAYDSARKALAFAEIYRKARKFWGVDIEDLNLTLPMMKDRLKSPNWIYMIGNEFLGECSDRLVPEAFSKQGGTIVNRKYGSLIVSAAHPDPLDTNRQAVIPQGLSAIAAAIQQRQLGGIGSFASDSFDQARTDAWFARFDPNASW